MAPQLASPGFGKEGLLPPCSPVQKVAGTPGAGSTTGSFWSSIPASPASRPGSFTFPGEPGCDTTLGRQNQNQNQNQGQGQGQSHRHSTHSKDADRMSTCSSASEQSVHSIQSNGVRSPTRAPGFLVWPAQINRDRSFLAVLFFHPYKQTNKLLLATTATSRPGQAKALGHGLLSACSTFGACYCTDSTNMVYDVSLWLSAVFLCARFFH